MPSETANLCARAHVLIVGRYVSRRPTIPTTRSRLRLFGCVVRVIWQRMADKCVLFVKETHGHDP